MVPHRLKGNHEPLIPPEMWYHYLKGTLYCGTCGSRLVISNAKSRSGMIYPYFVCVGRHRKRTPCTRSAILVEDAERLVIDYYRGLQIPLDVRDNIRGMATAKFEHLIAGSMTASTSSPAAPPPTGRATTRPAGSATRRSSPSSTSTRKARSDRTTPGPSPSSSTRKPTSGPTPGPRTLRATPPGSPPAIRTTRGQV